MSNKKKKEHNNVKKSKKSLREFSLSKQQKTILGVFLFFLGALMAIAFVSYIFSWKNDQSEIGHFKGAICPQSETFREELPEVLEDLKGKEDEKILLYCTGGIRCEKTSAYLKHHGFNDVNQLNGGIIDYARQLKKDDSIDNKFIGKNFVFDERLGERISVDVIANCHQCGEPSDEHVNCNNKTCNLLFIQCEKCQTKHGGCCTPECLDYSKLPEEEQAARRKGKNNDSRFHNHQKRDLSKEFK